jgi:hypothetical protein
MKKLTSSLFEPCTVGIGKFTSEQTALTTMTAELEEH